jgi:hypothetical protein
MNLSRFEATHYSEVARGYFYFAPSIAEKDANNGRVYIAKNGPYLTCPASPANLRFVWEVLTRPNTRAELKLNQDPHVKVTIDANDVLTVRGRAPQKTNSLINGRYVVAGTSLRTRAWSKVGTDGKIIRGTGSVSVYWAVVAAKPDWCRIIFGMKCIFGLFIGGLYLLVNQRYFRHHHYISAFTVDDDHRPGNKVVYHDDDGVRS